MDNREYLKQLISAYIDGETTAEETALVEKTLARDAELKKYYQDLKKLSSSLQSWPNEDLSPDLEQKVNKAYHKRREETQEMKKTWIPLTAASTAILAVIVLSVSLQVYTRRGIQGRLKTATDDIGARYSPAASAGQPVALKQYEPYYLDKKYDVSRARSLKGVTADDIGDQYAPQPNVMYGMGMVGDDSKRVSSLSITVGEEMIGQPVMRGVDWNTEGYDRIYENEYLEAFQNPLSTFSVDVDTASYSNVRRFLNQGQMPPEDSVRIEEMINYFTYNYPQPTGEEPFSVTAEVAPCPWKPEHKLALIGLQGKRLQEKEMPPSNLVFLIDVSGSMEDPNKLPLLKQAFRMMVQQLRAEDRIAIAVYAGAAGKILDPTPGDQKQTILNAIDNLQSGGSTAGGAGIKLAYELAKQHFIKGGNNRVVLATDGDFNIGVSSDGELVRIIEDKRKDGIFLTVLGFGTGNYKDSKMEKLADKGNGNYYYIDTIKEAKKVLVQELGSALFTIAKDVKLQIEFNPAQVKAYRLVGYENRILAKEDFNDDTKDAGEIGTGHTVTALYEVIPADSKETFGKVDDLKYQTTQIKSSDELLTVKLRYKKPDEDTSKLLTHILSRQEMQNEKMSENLSWASSVAEFGMLLRNSKYKGTATYQDTLKRAQAAKGTDPFGYRQEMIDLIQTAESLDVRTSASGGISTK